jgi:erythromycin esterase-like protein
MDSEKKNANALNACIARLTGAEDDYDELMVMIGKARFVLIGEATHGTHEFYQMRAAITQRLIAEKDFMAVAVEADWPDAWRVNRYVRGDKAIDDAGDALGDFRRFPVWMWRNTEVQNFIDWLYDYNHTTSRRVPAVGFYGLDLYSLNSSVAHVVDYLEEIDPEAAARARRRYGCLDNYRDPEAYGYETAVRMRPGCEQEVIAQLAEIQRLTFQHRHEGAGVEEDFFSAEQNARLVRHAEQYYRALFAGRPDSWNIRDTHMMDTLDHLARHLTRLHERPAKIVVWAHNSHVGDARATDAGRGGEITLGRLARERYGERARLIGFSTHHGSVTAASDWDMPVQHKRVRPAVEGSVESLFHRMEVGNFLLTLRENETAQRILSEPRLHRAIGVIYKPQTERLSHYYHTKLAEQYDAIVHIDATHALHPLETGEHWDTEVAEETYPFGV